MSKFDMINKFYININMLINFNINIKYKQILVKIAFLIKNANI